MTDAEWNECVKASVARQAAISESVTKSSLSDFARAWVRGAEDTLIGGTQLINPLQQSSWVYSAVTLIADTVSHIPFRILSGDDEDDEVVTGGPLVDLFRRPSEILNRFQFWWLVCVWSGLRGEAFIIALDKSGGVIDLSKPGRNVKIAKLAVLTPDKMQHRVEDNTLIGWCYYSSNQDSTPSLELLPGEVIHHRQPNPFNVWRGLSPLTVAMLAAQTDYNAAQFMKGLMGNNADTGLIVTTDAQPSAEQIEQITAKLRERKRKAGVMPPPMFLWGGSKIEKPTISNVDMQFLENRKFTRQEICAIYKVPQELLGFTEDANRSVSDSMRLSFMENRIAPYCRSLEADIEPVISAVSAGERGEFYINGTPVMQAAQRSRWDVATKAFAMGYSANECNETFDLGMPSDASRDGKFLPYSLQQIGDDGAPLPEPAPAEPASDVAAAADKALNILEAAQQRRPTTHVCSAGDEWLAATKGSVKRKRVAMRNFFVGQQARVLAKLDEASKSKSTSTSKAVDDVFNMLDENERLFKKLGPLLRADLEFGYAMIGKELGLGSIDIPPADAIAWLNERKNRISDINETTFNAIKDTLQDGLGKGDTAEQLADRVKEVYSDASDRRAESIAHTETNTALNSARQEAMEDVGVERKGWQTSNLEGVRESHLANEALSEEENGIPIDQAWPNGLQYPSDPSGPPGETINCRCFGFAILPEKGTGHRRPTLLTFDEWAAGNGGGQ